MNIQKMRMNIQKMRMSKMIQNKMNKWNTMMKKLKKKFKKKITSSKIMKQNNKIYEDLLRLLK